MTAKGIWICLAGALLLLIGVSFQVTIWKECRENGSSTLYCLRMVTR